MNTPNCLDALLEKTAQTLHTDIEVLNSWLATHPYLPHDAQIRLLHLMNKYQLDPWCEELVCYRNEAQEINILITIDGWYKIINQQSCFSGMSLREATTLTEGIPDWIECCIYRHDRILPIVVKEYLIELQTTQENWQKMPRRMLRHRAIQQCARLAFGISSPDASSHHRNMNLPTTSQPIPTNPKHFPLNQPRIDSLRQHLEKTAQLNGPNGALGLEKGSGNSI